MPIPSRVHRIWLDDPMPDQFVDYGLQWDRLHPGWERTDWMDSGALPELRNQDLFDRAKDYYPDDWKRLQADLLRLELLWLYGGVYVDTDARPLRDLHELLDGRSCIVARSPQHRRGVHPITNCFMAAAPGHPYIGALVDGCEQALEEYGDRNLAQSVGPWHLTRVYEAADYPDVTVAHHDFFGHWIGHDWNNAARKRGDGVWPEGAPRPRLERERSRSPITTMVIDVIDFFNAVEEIGVATRVAPAREDRSRPPQRALSLARSSSAPGSPSCSRSSSASR